MSRTAIYAAILALVFWGGCDSNTPPPNGEQEIIALERSALDKWAQSDTGGYVDICADEITWFDFTPGEQQRVDGLQAVRDYLKPFVGNIPPHTYDVVNPKVQMYGDTAVLTFHWKGVLKNGAPLDGWKVTSVYNWKDSKWRQVHAHWSAVQGKEENQQ